MNIYLLLLLHGVLSGMTNTPNPYNISYTDINGQQQNLGQYQGEKIWIVVLPATQTASDSLYLNRVDSIALANAGQMKTIAVPSYEDGYNDSLFATLQPFYQGLLDTSVSIAQAMYTHQASGSQQSPLFNWLTFASQNTYFQEEVGGPGEMYFIDGQGKLYGVYGPEAMNSNMIITNMLQ